ncbi:hypothetical protein [Vibrio misgurnus]|uniref:hypothetical protein n=1 Tax=Vibrio misgurnus TaxID=2993714 RepID=UPI0023F73F73|nr:hypothetical protein [Vibrio sp. VCS]
MNPIAISSSNPDISLQTNSSSASNSSNSALSQAVKSVKAVSFSLEVEVYELPESDATERKSEDRISMIEKEFRREVDAEARKHGLSWAENHTDWNSHYPFSLERALGTKLSSE